MLSLLSLGCEDSTSFVFEGLLHFQGQNAHLGSLKWRRRRASFRLRQLSLMLTLAMHAVGGGRPLMGCNLRDASRVRFWFGAISNAQIFSEYRTFHTAYQLREVRFSSI
jgi:hypothetical protein